jgi:hydroxyethylthiazole kinase-like uncharacterized protein yjeF
MAPSLPQRVLPGDGGAALHDTVASRAAEAEALARHAPHVLMQRAGIGVARLARAVAPFARRVWVAAGPGNNGGDGLVAATHLHRAGVAVQVTLLADEQRLPADAAAALADARAAGVPVSAAWPDGTFDLAIDALLGLGSRRAPQGAIGEAARRLGRSAPIRLAVDLPTGLDADTGRRLGDDAVVATHTLALLTLKPGLFTADGRDHAGEVWLDALGEAPAAAPAARLAGAADAALAPRRHSSHKGSFGDLAVVGGAPGMTGAALLAARAALGAGAGRVFVDLLGPPEPGMDLLRPELMFRPGWWRSSPATIERTTVVCGCGGGDAVRGALPSLLSRSPRLVLDADALNAIAADPALHTLLAARAPRGQATVLTPHPLEAARLLGIAAARVQDDRIGAALRLARRDGTVVVLKGSGTVIAAPGAVPTLNPTGDARLAAAGTGDVLAGFIGGLWAQADPSGGAESARHAAVAGAWLHGRAAERAPPGCRVVRAADLADWLAATAAAAA